MKVSINALASCIYACWYSTLASSQPPPNTSLIYNETSASSQPPLTSNECYGPRSPDELADFLWGSESKYIEYKRTRPNLSKLVSETPMAKPSKAEPDIVKVAIEMLSVKELKQIHMS